MKKTVFAVGLLTGFGISGASAAPLDVTQLELDTADFSLAGVTGSAFSFQNPIVAGSYQGSAGDISGDDIMQFTFGFFGPVSTYTAESVVGLSPAPCGGSCPAPSGTADPDAGTISMDMSSWFAFWNGNNFNQGDSSVSGTYTPIDDTSGTFLMSWSSEVVGGPFDGQIGNWTLGGTATVVPVPAAVWLLGSGLLGLIAVGKRRLGASSEA